MVQRGERQTELSVAINLSKGLRVQVSSMARRIGGTRQNFADDKSGVSGEGARELRILGLDAADLCQVLDLQQ